MKRILKGVGLGLGGLVVVAALVFLSFYVHVEVKRNSKVDVAVSSFEIPNDPVSIAEGKRLVQVKACADCHGEDFAGKTIIDEPPIGKFTGPNLTPGKGSVTARYKNEDWIRSIRFGVAPDGRPLIAMTAGDFHGISNEDLGKMIAYLKTLAPVDRENPKRQTVGPVARILYHLNQMPLLFPFEEVDLKAQPVDKVIAGPNVEYGKYLSMACTGCHGPGFSGGHIPGTPPFWPDAKNLTPSGRLAHWTMGDFKKVLREGKTPDGHQIDPQFMPWKSMQAMNDVEIEALYQFLKQVPAKAEGTR